MASLQRSSSGLSNLNLSFFFDRADRPMTALYEIICLSWFWWNLAIIFFMTSKEFQAIYKLIVFDIFDIVLHCMHKK